jgi:GrpB-like predicted nucleotidyltransferase (UPF0157 family)
MRQIVVVPYKDSWPKEFESEKDLIQRSVSCENMKIHHIGSTSVVGLSAKPIIDILVEVDNISELDGHNEEFETIGYECKGEFGIEGRRYFQKGGDNRTHQIHAFVAGSMGAIRHLAFRDYLIAHKEIADKYADIKYIAAKNCQNNIDLYCKSKNDFVVLHEKLALDWAAHA